MALSKTKNEEFTKELLAVIANDFEYACHIARIDRMQAFVCLARKKGKSYGEIANVLSVTRQAILKRAKRCDACSNTAGTS